MTDTCEGCGAQIPYDVGEDGCYGETLKTPLGFFFSKTCRRRECVEAARVKHDGKKVEDPYEKAQRKKEETYGGERSHQDR